MIEVGTCAPTSGSFATLPAMRRRGTNHAYKHCHASTVRAGTAWLSMGTAMS
jgi:hypothetical protein